MSDDSSDQVRIAALEQARQKRQEALVTEARQIYRNQPLSSSEKNIRLLSLEESSAGTGLLSGETRIVALEADYAALSYVWGDEDKDRCPIRLNGVDTTITANLGFLLRRLRSEGKFQNIWIDAICINQTDLEEKSHQVKMMDEVYKHANQRTIVWLGESTEDSDQAMELVHNATEVLFQDFQPAGLPPVWRALKRLVGRAWWKRAWVIQEALLSPNPIVKCGAFETPFEKFVAFRNLHWDAEQVDIERFRPLRNLWKECPYAQLMYSNWKSWVGSSLHSWLGDTTDFQCRYQRDIFYCLLGLVPANTRTKLIPDYDKKSDRDVFLEATVCCFTEVGLLPLHQVTPTTGDSLSLPSWCPNWRVKRSIVPFIGFGFKPFPIESNFSAPPEKWIYSGDQEVKSRFMFSKDNEILFFHGFIVDTVAYVNGVGTEGDPEIPAYLGEDMQRMADERQRRLDMTKKACKRWERYVAAMSTGSYGTIDDTAEAFYRTVAADRDWSKQPWNGNLKVIYEDWVSTTSHTTASISSPEAVPSQEQIARTKDYSNSVVSRCYQRTFIATTQGRFGLAPQHTQVGDLVCIVYSADTPFILRKPPPERDGQPGTFIGESYIHGIMQGEYMMDAKVEDFTGFWVK